jgi:hypothetical protein
VTKSTGLLFIGEISTVYGEPGDGPRIVVAVSRFARCNIPGVWTRRGSNPVRYASMLDLDINLKRLNWEDWTKRRARGLRVIL